MIDQDVLYCYNGLEFIRNKAKTVIISQSAYLNILVFYLYASTDMREFGAIYSSGYMNIDTISRFNTTKSF